MTDIQKQLDDLDEQIGDLHEKKSKIVRHQLELLKKGKVLEIVKEIVWVYPSNRYLNTLEPRQQDIHKFDIILNILQAKGYHFQEAFCDDKTWLCLDDSKCLIRFKTSEYMHKFISEHRLKIDLNLVDKRLKEIQTDLMKYAAARHKMEPYEHKEEEN